MNSSIVLTTSQVLTLPIDSSSGLPKLPPCTLKWRQGKLWIKQAERPCRQLPALENEQWLINCLKRSPVQHVCLSPELGETGVRRWADLCQQANKQLFLRIPSHRLSQKRQRSWCWRFKRAMDWTVAALLLVVLSPLMLGIAGLIKVGSPGPVLFQQWRVGKRGRLFRVLKFRTMGIDAEQHHHEVMKAQAGLHKRPDDPRITSVGRWLRRYSLDELPQLLNVLRGEMSLVGPRPWALYDALRISAAGRQRLSALPGMTGAWQVKARSEMLNLDAVTACDLEYLHHWSLAKDLWILLVTMPRVLSGFGAH